MGSSMGGLISNYGAVQFPQIFKKVGLLSPSFWFTDTIFQQVHTLGVQPDMKFYFVSGTTEDSSMVPLMKAMRDSVVAKGLSVARTNLLTWADGQHAEWFWSREFPAAYQWLFNDLTTATTAGQIKNTPSTTFKLYPNPASESVFVGQGTSVCHLNLMTIEGKGCGSFTTYNGVLNTSSIPNGVYILELAEEQGLKSYQKLVIQH
jgi:hypothetical protein